MSSSTLVDSRSFSDMVKDNLFVVLDTETTGLDSLAEVCSIGIVDRNGVTLLDTLVKPRLCINKIYL